MAVGIAIGWLWPATGIALKPLGEGFIKLVKMIIAPVIFCTVVHGVVSMSDKNTPERKDYIMDRLVVLVEE